MTDSIVVVGSGVIVVIVIEKRLYVPAGVCRNDYCFDVFWDESVQCSTYRPGGVNDGGCELHSKCRQCSCSCYTECTSDEAEGPCPDDDPDLDSDYVSCLCCMILRL